MSSDRQAGEVTLADHAATLRIVRYEIVQGDTAPALGAESLGGGAQLKDRRGIAPLTGATVEFRMQQRDGDIYIAGDATVVDEDAGLVIYEWADGDTDVPGIYDAVFVVTGTDGVTTYPGGVGAESVEVVVKTLIAPPPAPDPPPDPGP